MPQVAEKSNLTLPISCPLVNVNHCYLWEPSIESVAFQVTYMFDGYYPELPESLQYASQNGDCAGRADLIFDGEVVLDLWSYITIVKA
jgi:hypothetical protein